ncbi:hypothetical protein [Novosphingobium sp.]|nr:hypothetical protein [Novosphingobium sp.]
MSCRVNGRLLRVVVIARAAPGTPYTTFHHPATQTNVKTIEFFD